MAREQRTARVWMATMVGVVGCASVPEPLVRYAEETLPRRNAREYADLEEELRAELVHQDATAACSVAVASGKEDKDAPACSCASSAQDDWKSACQAWFASVPGGLTPEPDDEPEPADPAAEPAEPAQPMPPQPEPAQPDPAPAPAPGE
jgi:hypothetical protein